MIEKNEKFIFIIIIIRIKNMTIKFKLIENDFNDHVYLKWRGKYTVGDVNVRGTRVWFQSTCAEVVQSDHYMNMNAKNIQKDIDNENNDFPGDVANLREESLEIIIKKLTSDCLESEISDCTYAVESHILKHLVDQDVIHEYADSKESFSHIDKKQLMIVDYGMMKRDENGKVIPEALYIVKDLNNMLKELKEVLKFATTNNVTWIWV